MITSAQIHDKVFERRFRGYDEQEVDEFLDQIAAYIDTISRENRELREKLKTASEQLAYMKSLEETLRETLVTAQRSAEETGRNAQIRAEETISAANEQARLIVQRAQNDTASAEKQIEDLHRQASVYRSNFRMLMQAQLKILEENSIDPERDREAVPSENAQTIVRRRGVLMDEPLQSYRRPAEQEENSTL